MRPARRVDRAGGGDYPCPMTSAREPIHVVGGGLAGSEAAWQLAGGGHAVILHEMRPERRT
ncbi:FAD-dependent oxidoreductase, partial [Acinetobacter baumannii]|uniref:FAD-dependent oxidoreductase n=1 Tax=Acinetobacter baumannii TaxID=470 RepID=UPI001C093D74